MSCNHIAVDRRLTFTPLTMFSRRSHRQHASESATHSASASSRHRAGKATRSQKRSFRDHSGAARDWERSQTQARVKQEEEPPLGR